MAAHSGRGHAPFRFDAYPVDGPRGITQAFGARPEVYAPYGFPGHEGVDLRAALGAAVRSVAAGTVAKLTTAGNYGNRIDIQHAGGYTTTYAHLDRVAALTVGAAVAAGQVIGYAGSSGNSTGAHLHLSLKRDGYTYTSPGGVVWPFNIFDPTPYLMPHLGVDLLPYFRGDGRIYEVRHGDGQTETFQTQTDGETFYLVKNSQFEQLYADAEYIWRGLDTSPGNGRFYVQREPGKQMARWCPRRMSPGQTWVGPGHVVQFYLKADCSLSAANSGPATNRLTFVAQHAARTWNGVTVADVVELTDGRETFFFGRGFGLVAWGSGWGASSIAQVFAPGERQPLTREKLPCAY